MEDAQRYVVGMQVIWRVHGAARHIECDDRTRREREIRHCQWNVTARAAAGGTARMILIRRVGAASPVTVADLVDTRQGVDHVDRGGPKESTQKRDHDDCRQATEQMSATPTDACCPARSTLGATAPHGAPLSDVMAPAQSMSGTGTSTRLGTARHRGDFGGFVAAATVNSLRHSNKCSAVE